MPKSPKLAPGRKRLDKPKLKGMSLLAFNLYKCHDRYANRIRKQPIDWLIFDEYKDECWRLCRICDEADEFEKRLFFVSRLEQMLETLETFIQTGF